MDDAPVGDRNRMLRVGDVDQAEVTASLLITETARRGLLLVLARGNAGVDERLPEVVPVVELELVQPARAAPRAQEPKLVRVLGIGDVEEHEAAREALVEPRATAHLDADGRDVVTLERPVPRREHRYVFRGCARRVHQARDHDGVLRIRRVDDGDTVLRRLRAEAGLGARRPVGEAPVPDVGVLLVHPDVGVEAAAAEVVLSDDLHIPCARSLLAAGVGLVRLLEEVPLLLEELCLVRRRSESDGDERERRSRDDGDAQPGLTHISPFPRFSRSRHSPTLRRRAQGRKK
jgi:hypothetical protein